MMNRTVACPALVVLFTAIFALTPSARAGFGDMNPRFDFVFGDGPGMPSDVLNVTGQQASLSAPALKLFGSMGPLDGARFQDSFVFYFSGPYEGILAPGDTVAADLDFTVNVTAGQASWQFYNAMYGADPAAEWVQAGTSLAPVPVSGHVSGVHIETPAFVASGVNGYYQGYLNIQWTGYAATDTLTLTIPQNSIDTVVSTPEPFGAPFALAALRLRRARRTNGQAPRTNAAR
jgi:hypothetical protein